MKLLLSTILIFSLLNANDLSIRDVFNKDTQAKSLGGLKDNKEASEDGIGNVVLGLDDNIDLKKEIAANKLVLENDLNNVDINQWLVDNNVNNELLSSFDLHKDGHVFNGKNFLMTNNTSMLNLSEYSIFVSFKPTSVSTSQTLLAYGETFDTDIMGYQVYLEDNKVKLWFEDTTTTDHRFSSLSNIIPNEWNNLLIVRNNYKVEIYLNGKIDATYDTIPSNVNINHMLTIGVKTNSGNRYESFYTGTIENIKIYSHVLNSTEISSIFNKDYMNPLIDYNFYHANINETKNIVSTQEIQFN